jgi:hypothetical protein
LLTPNNAKFQLKLKSLIDSGILFRFFSGFADRFAAFVLGNCEDDEKGCADGDPWWEVVFCELRFMNMATG